MLLSLPAPVAEGLTPSSSVQSEPARRPLAPHGTTTTWALRASGQAAGGGKTGRKPGAGTAGKAKPTTTIRLANSRETRPVIDNTMTVVGNLTDEPERHCQVVWRSRVAGTSWPREA